MGLIGEWLIFFFLLSGSSFVCIGSWGIVKMPDVLCRAHALSKALTLGIALMLLGLWVSLEGEKIDIKIFLAILFLITTIPIAGHLFALLAYRIGFPKDSDSR